MEGYWGHLADALDAVGFVTYTAADIGRANLSSLDTAVGTVEHVFTQVTETREWPVIARQLSTLAMSATTLSLRPKDENLDIVLGRVHSPVSVDEMKQYVEFVQRLLHDLYPSAEAMRVSPEVEKQADDAAGVIGAPEARAAARLVVPLLRFRGIFRCVIVNLAQSIDGPFAAAWNAATLSAADTWVQRATVQAWLWDVNTGHVYDTRENQLKFAHAYIPDLSSAQQLEQDLTYTQGGPGGVPAAVQNPAAVKPNVPQLYPAFTPLPEKVPTPQPPPLGTDAPLPAPELEHQILAAESDFWVVSGGGGAQILGAKASAIGAAAVKEAATQVGVVEQGQNAGVPLERYVRWFVPNSGPVYWCAYFVSWCVDQVTDKDHHAPWAEPGYVGSIYAWAKEHGCLIDTPAHGDIFGLGDRHTGFIAGADPRTGALWTTEGNWADRVGHWPRNYKTQQMWFARL